MEIVLWSLHVINYRKRRFGASFHADWRRGCLADLRRFHGLSASNGAGPHASSTPHRRISFYRALLFHVITWDGGKAINPGVAGAKAPFSRPLQSLNSRK